MKSISLAGFLIVTTRPLMCTLLPSADSVPSRSLSRSSLRPTQVRFDVTEGNESVRVLRLAINNDLSCLAFVGRMSPLISSALSDRELRASVAQDLTQHLTSLQTHSRTAHVIDSLSLSLACCHGK